MNNRDKKICILIIMLVILMIVSSCKSSTNISDDEMKNINSILGKNLSEGDLTDVTAEAMTDSRKTKFPAVKMVYTDTDSNYIFVSEPVAYNGPVTLVTVINSKENKTVGMRIVKHNETEHYVRDMTSNWFTDRFKNKSTDKYLQAVKLEQTNENEIIMITGATVTTEGIINGVNSAMGVYEEYVLGKESEAVELMVEDIDR